jgi:hypothetical protein
MKQAWQSCVDYVTCFIQGRNCSQLLTAPTVNKEDTVLAKDANCSDEGKSAIWSAQPLLRVSGQFQAPAALNPGGRAPGTHWMGSWVDTRACLDDMEK